MIDLNDLEARLEAATGGDAGLDEAVAAAFACPPRHYTGSVDLCRDLVATALPGWKLHVGFDVTGVFPYAALTKGDIHLDAEAAALPLAILRVAVAAAKAAP